MSRDNVGTVKDFYDLLNRDEIEEALEHLHPDVVADFSRALNPDTKGVYRGRDQVQRLFQRFLEAWDEPEFFDEEFVEVGDDVIRVGGIRARGRGSGVEVVGRAAQLWRFQDGDAVRMELFQSKDDALEHLEGG